MRWRDHRWMALATALVATLAVVGSWAAWSAHSATHDAIEVERRLRLDQAASAASIMIDTGLEAMALLGASGFELVPGSTGDRVRLAVVTQGLETRAGAYLVDDTATVVSGMRLVDEAVVGTTVDRPGLATALAEGRPTFLPVAEGLTSSQPTLAMVGPVTRGGEVIGAMVREVEVAPDAAFTTTLLEHMRGDPGVVSMIDTESGLVLASTDPDLVGVEADGMVPTDPDRATTAVVPTPGWLIVHEGSLPALAGARLVALVAVVAAGVVALAVVAAGLVGQARSRTRLALRTEALRRDRNELMRVVADDVRTPITGVVGFLRTALEHWHDLDDDERRRTLARALDNARALQRFTSDVVASDLPAPLRTAPVELDRVLATALAGRDLRRTGPTPAVSVLADARQLGDALGILAAHAADQQPEGTSARVEVVDSVDCIEIRFSDDGPPLLTTDPDLVFDQFAAPRGIGPGPGLTLHTARRVIEDHGGRVWAEPAERGATMVAQLPVVQMVTPPSMTTTDPVM